MWSGNQARNPFLKNQVFIISLDQRSKVSYNLFLLCVQFEDCQSILKWRCHLLLLHINKKGFGASLPALFCACFLKKNISSGKFYQLTKSHCLIAFTFCFCFYSFISGNMSIAIVFLPACDVMNFEICLTFLVNLFSYNIKKVGTKIS